MKAEKYNLGPRRGTKQPQEWRDTMKMEKRRGGARREVNKPSRLGIAAGALAVETVNVSRHGALVKAKGRIAVVLSFQGKMLRGRLLRATPAGGDITKYAVQLDDALDPYYY